MTSAEPSGWYLPKGDNYFAQFMPGPPRKQNGFQREHLLEAFKYVKQWRMAVDVGAHVGFWTWDMAHRFERVYAFEAAPDTYDCLVKNMADQPHVVTANFACGDKNGRCRVITDESRKGNTGSRFVVAGERPGEPDVPMVAIDELHLAEPCGLLKVDVEGFELQVLQGAMKLIETHKPVIIMETDKKFSRDRYGVPHGASEQLLVAKGYRCVAHMRPDKVFVCV